MYGQLLVVLLVACVSAIVPPPEYPGYPELGCTYKGKRYSVGDKFPAGDGCNTCTCKSGGIVSCTEKYCAPVDVCSLPKPNCQGYFKRWWYNSKTNSCEQFTGCKGKGNNFHSKNACLTKCRPYGHGK